MCVAVNVMFLLTTI